ncbi:glutamate racemase [Nesterenkonia muleiensis]|uniref:glutamate racemase n=1 Tax=Nesterenkonia muleiensis TaxID=2282648 RepID=UPI000E7351B5|nr:aspartate/glutamate racemase family protein [Nesterenkonia muleiensis]
MKIGVFDSGAGGEAVAATLRELLPHAVVSTASDREHVPYGSRSDAEVLHLTDRAIQPLLRAGCEVIVLACNTATAAAVEHLRQDYPATPFVGLEPMVKPASAITRSKSIIVCATPATLRSRRYQRLKDTWGGGVNIVEPDCADWAAAIERGEPETIDLEPLRLLVQQRAADVVVLGCTHYHWIKHRVQQAAGAEVTVLEPTDAIAAQIRRVTAAAAGR